MSLNSVRYGCTSLLGVNKAGELKQDANGYYEMIVGGLDVYNSAGLEKEFDKETIITESAKAEDKNMDNIESEYNFL